MEFLVSSIAADFNKLHTVKQWTWNIACVICCGYEQNLGQIQRQFHIVISEMAVLLWVQYFQKCRGSVSFVITAYFVNLIQQHKRIAYARLSETIGDSAGHRTDIGSSMTSDLSFISHTTKTDPYIFLIQCICYGFRYGSLTGSGRSHQTKNRCFSFTGQRSHCQIFQDSFFHLLQSIMIAVENFLCLIHINGILRYLIPWQFEQSLDIATLHSAL